MSAVDDVLAGLIDSFRNREVWIFAGAGISVSSGLPVVRQLVPYVLRKLGVSGRDVETYTASGFCFEEFLQIVLQNSDPEDAPELLDLFREGQPNANHHLLAKLAKSGYATTVITTNFDLLIERALDAEGWKRGADYTVFHRDEDFDAIDWNDPRPRVVKIHGSVEDGAAMAITLQQVARKELSVRRRGVIERAFSGGAHERVLVLGYSSSDVFDISPHIATLGGELKQVVVLEHQASSESPRVENLADRPEKNPFKQFVGSHRLYWNTDTVTRKLWRALLPAKTQRSRRGTTRWRECVDDWYRLTTFRRSERGPAIAGRLFYSISAFEAAARYLNEAAALVDHWDRDEQNALDLLLGNIYARVGDLERAVIAHYGPAFERCKAMPPTTTLIELMTSAAALFCEAGESDKASRYFMQALLKAQELGGEKESLAVSAGWADALNQSGSFARAGRMLASALAKADELGDVRAKAAILGYLGDCHAGLKEHEKAIGYYEQAVEADRHLGNKRGEGLHFAQIGDVHAQLGRYDRAVECYQHALRIADAMGDDETKAIALAILGSIRFTLGACTAAVRDYREVLRLCARDGEENDRAQRLRVQVRQAHDQRLSELMQDLEESGLDGTPEGTEALRQFMVKERELLKRSEAPAALEKKNPALTMKLQADAWVGLGNCYVKLKDDRAALEAYEKGERYVSLTDQEKHAALVRVMKDLRKKLSVRSSDLPG